MRSREVNDCSCLARDNAIVGVLDAKQWKTMERYNDYWWLSTRIFGPSESRVKHPLYPLSTFVSLWLAPLEVMMMMKIVEMRSRMDGKG